jgi:ABC-type transport system involved in Fe-S cluster assembly fused permease/ATPase subunit
VAQYDAHLSGFQRASVRTEQLSAALNAGQALILTAGMVGVMGAALRCGRPSTGRPRSRSACILR